eukprot:Lithocolla_globosa_v1_NODE_4456_length_1431_cov_2.904797.p1 type:complete len:109 gc:universal NODE_4456_length_1431_cov_2.904797:1294-968(-)
MQHPQSNMIGTPLCEIYRQEKEKEIKFVNQEIQDQKEGKQRNTKTEDVLLQDMPLLKKDVVTNKNDGSRLGLIDDFSSWSAPDPELDLPYAILNVGKADVTTQKKGMD